MKILNLILIIILFSCKENKIKNDLSTETDSFKNKININTINDTLHIQDNEIYILVFPSHEEVEILKKKMGEEEFYLAADGENGYASAIYKLLKEKNKKYINTDKGTIVSKNAKAIFRKNNLKNAWGVLYFVDNKFTFMNSIDFIEYMENLPLVASEKIDCHNDIVSDTFSFTISSDETTVGTVLIDIQNKKDLTHQKINYTFNSLVESKVSCSFISYFRKKTKLNEGLEEYHSFIIDDYNFDGLEDFAIINDSGNGGPQYAYYIQKANKEFQLEENLTENMRYFPVEINKIEKTLKISHPSGCCKISTYKIQLQPNGEWKEVYSKLEDM